MKKNDIKVLPDFYERYINEIEDLELFDALRKYNIDILNQNLEKLIALGNKVYAENKWTVKEILQHLIDCERIFLYRALCISRNDKTPLPGFDEDKYIPEAKTDRRSFDELLNEFESVRNSGIILFNSFDDTMLKRKGKCSGNEISVLAIGFTIAGHTFHHINVIKEKYFPLI
jgi:hypothetical protein